jgi:deoxyribonuclease IV
MVQRPMSDLLGAHVSTQGGVPNAPARGVAIGASAVQVFTKTPNQWREPAIEPAIATAFRRALAQSGIVQIVAHDSYLINLASPDRTLRQRSEASFMAELTRCERLGIRYVVSHPGNYIDDRASGLARNAESYTRCLETVRGKVGVLLETTAGTGTALGSTFEELAALRDAIGRNVRRRVAFCADTCHLYSAGHDLKRDYDAVWRRWDDTIGLDNLRVLHLNDSKTPFHSRRDRHELIGVGSLGPEPFRRIMRDPRFVAVAKILETPKGDDEFTQDRRMMRRLRAYARVRPVR